MVPVLLLLPLLAVSQLCTCYDNDSQGHWDGPTCNVCGVTAGASPVQYSGPQCKNLPLRVFWPSATYYCNGVTDDAVCNNIIIGGSLLAGGTCANRTSCLCIGNRAGTYCERCATGWGNYPLCDQPACNSTSCSGNGACQDAVPCGRLSCNPATETCQVDALADGRRFYTCRPLTASPCGGSGTTALHVGVGPGFVAPAAGCAQEGPYVYNPAGPSVTVAWSCAGQVNGRAACCPAETTGCRGNANTIPPNNEIISCCKKSQTCCHGQCCDSNEMCKALPTPPGGWKYAPQYDCVPSYLSNVSAIRVVVLPLFLTVATIIATALAFRVGAPISMAAPGGILVFFAIFVLFSPNWPYALLTLVAVYFTLASSKAKSSNKYLFAFIFLVIVLAILIGGVGLGVIWVNTPDPFFPVLAGGRTFNPTTPIDSKSNLVGFQAACAQYYNYFFEDPYYLRPVTSDYATGQAYWGYCDQKWLAAQQFFYVCIIVFLLILTATTSYAYGNDEAPAGTGDKI